MTTPTTDEDLRAFGWRMPDASKWPTWAIEDRGGSVEVAAVDVGEADIEIEGRDGQIGVAPLGVVVALLRRAGWTIEPPKTGGMR